MSHSSAEFNLRYVLRALSRRLPIFVLCVVLVPAAAVIVSLLQNKEYTAKASLLFRDPQLDQKLFGATFVQPSSDPQRAAATNLSLVTLQRVAALTAAHLHRVTPDQVSSAVSASNEGQADLVSIEATASTPRFAARLANTFANTFIAFRRDADRAKLVSAEASLRRQIAALPPAQRAGPLGQSLQQRLSQLSALASLQTGNAELVQPAPVPSAPSSPKPIRNAAFGLFFGLLLGVALVALVEALDRRMRDPAEIEQLFARPLLAALPRSAALSSADPALLSVPPGEREAFRMLWVNLRYFSLSRDIRSILVASADRDDGKSTAAWGLSVAAASAGSRTLLIEADLRNPSFSRRFNIESRDGLTSVLAHDVSRAEATVRVPLPLDEGDAEPVRGMDVLLAGPRPPDPTDLLQSSRMAEFLREVEDEYDLVIVDTPPATTVSDAIPLITMVRGVIVVSRLGNTIREHLRRLRHQLDHLEAPVLGIVVNAVAGPDPYGYAYGYGYGDREVSDTRASGLDRTGGVTEGMAANLAATSASVDQPPSGATKARPKEDAEPSSRTGAEQAASAGGWQQREDAEQAASAGGWQQWEDPGQAASARGWQAREGQRPGRMGERNGAGGTSPTRRRRLSDWLR